mgnify:CR=1 FL=1
MDFWKCSILIVFLMAIFIMTIIASCSCDDDDDDDTTDDDDDNDGDDDDDDDDDSADDDSDDDDDDDDDTTDDDTGPEFWPPEAGTVGTYRLCYDPSETICHNVPVTIVGQDSETFVDGTYTKMEIGDFTQADPFGMIVWLDLSTENRVGFKASEAYFGGIGDGGEWDMYAEAQTIVEIPFDAGIGVMQQTGGDVDFYFKSKDPDEVHSFALETTLLATDATVTVPFGTVTDCWEIQCDMTITDPYGTYTDSYTMYYHPDYALVQSPIMPGFCTLELVSWEY